MAHFAVAFTAGKDHGRGPCSGSRPRSETMDMAPFRIFFGSDVLENHSFSLGNWLFWPEQPVVLARATNREKERDRDRERQRERERETERQRDRETERQRDREAHTQTDRQTGRQADRQTSRQADRQTDRQTERERDYLQHPCTCSSEPQFMAPTSQIFWLTENGQSASFSG